MKFSWRRFTALTAGLSLFFVVITGLELLTAPAGRFGHAVGWTFWGASKRELLNAHVFLAILVGASSLCHIYFNWGSIERYILSRDRETAVCSVEFLASLALVIFVLLCAL
jgi:hypothetical protein